MKQKAYKWLERLVDKITKKDCPNNNYFEYYGHRVDLQSGTVDYVDVHISDMDYNNQINFSFDYWTFDLCFFSYNNFDERDSIIRAFKGIYSDRFYRAKVKADEPWDKEMKVWEPLLGNEEYDQDAIRKEYDYLMERKAA